MNTNYLRIAHTNEGNESSLEFAANYVKVDVYLRDMPEQSDSFSVRMYSSSLSLMGVDTFLPSALKTPKHLNFLIQSAYEWKNEDYVFFIYRNDIPVWFSRVYLPHEEWEDSSKSELFPISSFPIENFFVTKVCLTEWWQEYERFKFERVFTNRFLEQVRLLNWTHETNHYPYYFVVGPTLSAYRFAQKVLTPILAKGTKMKVVDINLELFLQYVARLNKLTDEMNKNDIVLLNFSQLSTYYKGEMYFNYIINRIETKKITCKVIFYGLYKDMLSFRQYSSDSSFYYNLANTFELPEKTTYNLPESGTSGWICGQKSICGRSILSPHDPDDYTPEEIKHAEEVFRQKLIDKYVWRVQNEACCECNPDLFLELTNEILKEGISEEEIRLPKIEDSDPFKKDYYVG